MIHHSRLLILTQTIVLLSAQFLITALQGAGDTKTEVVAAIPPLAWFADQIGGEHVHAHSYLESGQAPHTFQLSPSQMKRLSSADLYLFIGLPFERELAKRLKSNYPEIIYEDVTSGIAKFKSRKHDHGKESVENEDNRHSKRESDHHHAHGDHDMGYDPHVWLDPLRAIVIAKNIRDAFIEVKPEHAADFRNKYDSLVTRLESLHEHLASVLEPVKDEKFYVYHPAFQYFARRYGLEEVSIEREGKSPSPKELSGVIKEARGMPVIFRQPQFPDESVNVLAEAIDAEIEVLDPLAYNYEANLKKVGARIKTALRIKQNAGKPIRK